MKKNILIFTAAAACIMLFSGCSSQAEDTSELDNLLEQLQTTHLNTGSPEEGAETEEAIPFKSLTGTVSSFSESELTVKADGKEQKFTLDESTQILGGDRDAAKTVTVTYCEPEKKSRSTVANVITILETTDTGTENTSAEPTSGLDTETTDGTSGLVPEETATEQTNTQTETQSQSEETGTAAETENDTQVEEQTENQTEETETPTEADTQSQQQTE